MPRDRTYTNNVGSGLTLADLQAYWKNHHGTSTLPTGVNTRWKAYQCEMGLGQFAGVAGCPPTWQTDTVENHVPVCTNSTVPPTDTAKLSRRILNVGVVDCSYWGITGNKLLPTSTLVDKFFLTEQTEVDSTSPSINSLIL